MNFADGMKDVIKNLDVILAVSDLLTPENIALIGKLSDVDAGKTKKLVKAAKELKANELLFGAVLNSLPEIKEVRLMKNQLDNVLNARDHLGKVAGSIDQIQTVGDNLDALDDLARLVPDTKKILEMKPLIQDMLDNSIDIEEVSKISRTLRSQIARQDRLDKKMEEDKKEISKILNEIKKRESLMEERYEQMKKIHSTVTNFNIKIDNIGYGDAPTSFFDSDRGTVYISIPQGMPGNDGIRGEKGLTGDRGVPGSVEFRGEKGDTGEKGKNGSDFSATGYGKLAERSRFNNNPPGTSFVALDRMPAMVYFRIGNTSGNWTEGQPFGFVEGLTEGTATNAERLNGYTVQELMQFIQRKLQE